jgi:hypothetical protein
MIFSELRKSRHFSAEDIWSSGGNCKEIKMYLEVRNMLKKKLVKLAILSIAATALMAATGFASDRIQLAEQSKPEAVTVQGVVNATTDANNVVTAVTVVTTEGDVYNVVLNAVGLELGETMNGKEVEVQGTVSVQEEQNWINVHSYKAVEKAAEPE